MRGGIERQRSRKRESRERRRGFERQRVIESGWRGGDVAR